MNQLTGSYRRHLVIGDGRLARHWFYYLNSLDGNLKSVSDKTHVQDSGSKSITKSKSDFSPNGVGRLEAASQWARSQFEDADQADAALKKLLTQADMAWILISDREIEPFINSHSDFHGRWVHCSGALNLKDVWDLHPLMTFSHQLYPPQLYSQIPLVTSSSEARDFFRSLLPNPIRLISPSEKALYHALCVLMGNGVQSLINATTPALHELGLEVADFKLLIQKSISNILEEGPIAQTGPWVRGDNGTAQMNRQALQKYALTELYSALEGKTQQRINGESTV